MCHQILIASKETNLGMCIKCTKKIGSKQNKLLKLLCRQCCYLLHMKCNDMCNWECVTCMKEKFHLNSLYNREKVKEVVISNYECKCVNVRMFQVIH